MKRNIYIGRAFGAALLALGLASTLIEKRAVVYAATTQAPRFEVPVSGGNYSGEYLAFALPE